MTPRHARGHNPFWCLSQKRWGNAGNHSVSFTLGCRNVGIDDAAAEGVATNFAVAGWLSLHASGNETELTRQSPPPPSLRHQHAP